MPAAIADWLASAPRRWGRNSWWPVIPLFPLIYYAAFWLRFEGQIPLKYWNKFLLASLVMMAVKWICFSVGGVFRNWNQYLTFNDLIRIAQVSTVASMVYAILEYLVLPWVDVPRSVFILDWAGTLLIVGGLRSLGRIREELPWCIPGLNRGPRALIVGATHGGVTLLRSLRSHPLSYDVRGFITDDPTKVKTAIGGVPVVGTVDQTCSLARSLGVREILVISDAISGRELRRLVEQGRSSQLSIKVLPSLHQLLEGRMDITPRQICIEDLLRREPVELNQQELQQWLNGKVLMVTGSAGSIGSEICRQLLAFRPQRLILLDRWENGQFELQNALQRLGPSCPVECLVADGNDRSRVAQVLQRFRPQILFHAAAYKHVPLMEANPTEAVKNIVVLTQTLADLAVEYEVQSFVMISTDKAVNPTSVMGACKRVAEIYCQSLKHEAGCRFVTVRFGNVLGSSGSVVPTFRQQIARGGPVTITHPEMRRYFMTIPEAAQLVIQAGAMGRGGEIFVLDMGQPVRIVELAEEMIRLSGLTPGKDIELEFVGLRPGEKLFEELYIDGESHIATSHPKIVVAQSRTSSRLEAARMVRRLANLAEHAPQLILDELHRAVPEFRHASGEVPAKSGSISLPAGDRVAA